MEENKGTALKAMFEALAGASKELGKNWKAFLDFLDSKGALKQFLYNYVKSIVKTVENSGHYDPDYFADPKEIPSWISGAFIWSRTEKGHDYWSRLDDDWRQVCKTASKIAALKEEYEAVQEKARSLKEQIERYEKMGKSE